MLEKEKMQNADPYKRLFWMAVLVLPFLFACQAFGTPQPARTPPTGNPPPESPTQPLATLPPSPPPAAQDTPTPADAEIRKAQIFLVALADNGVSGKPTGCGDSVVPVEVEITPTTDPASAIQQALSSLLAAGDQYSGTGGLYNALIDTQLQVESAAVDNGNATVSLVGTFQLGGVCDNPRFGAQLEETVLQFPQVERAFIFINGKPLDEVLSLR